MIKIFISSTFRDMHNERDALQCITLPLVKKVAYRYWQTVSFVDLRWGVDTGDGELSELESSEKVLRRCLQAVEDCQPPLVAMLGDRYGWIPGKEDPAKAETIRRIAEEKGLEGVDADNASITSLEIAYGSKLCRAQCINPLVYVRHLQGEEATESAGDYPTLLNDLKERLATDSYCTVQEYTVVLKENTAHGVDAFAKQLAADLIAILEPRWERLSLMTRMERSFLMQRSSLTEAGNTFRGRQALLDDLLGRLERGVRVLGIQGHSGCGKTALCSRLMTLLQEKGWDTLPLVAGYSPDIATAPDVIRHIVAYLEEELEDKSRFTEEANTKGNALSTENWYGRMNELCERFIQTDRKLVILLDGVDQLDADSDRGAMAFLPKTLGDNLRFVMTATEEVPLRDGDLVHPKVPDRQDVLAFIEGTLYEDMKELPQRIREAIADKAMANDPMVAPLYVCLLLQRLGLMTKEELAGSADDVKARQLSLIRQLPGTVGDLTMALIDYACQRLEAPFLSDAVRYVALSDYGLLDTHLLALIGAGEEPDEKTVGVLKRFLYFLRDCFTEQDDGRYRFAHALIRRAVLHSMPEEERCARHRRLAQHLSGLQASDISYDEAGVHYLLAGDAPSLAVYLRNTPLICNPAMTARIATHIVRACLEDEGERLLSFMKEDDETVDYLARFMMGSCRPLFDQNAEEQQVLLRILQGLYARLQNSVLQEAGRLCRCAGYIAEAAELCDMPAEDRRLLQVYYAYAAYSYAQRALEARDNYRNHKQWLSCKIDYARYLKKGTLRQQLLESVIKERPSPDMILRAVRCLAEDETVPLCVVTGQQRRRYDKTGNREDLLALIDIYYAYFERKIAERSPMDESMQTALEELQALVEDAGNLPLTRTERLWLQAAHHCAVSAGFIPSHATEEDVQAAHRYTDAAWNRYRFERSPRSLTAMRGAMLRENVAVSLRETVCYSLPLLVTAVRCGLLDTSGEVTPHGEGMASIERREKIARLQAGQIRWFYVLSSPVMRVARLQAAMPEEGAQLHHCLEELVTLYRLGKRPDRALFTALRRALTAGQTADARRTAIGYATMFLSEYRQNYLSFTMEREILQVRLEEMLAFLRILWDSTDLSAGEEPAALPADMMLAYARWALEGLMAVDEVASGIGCENDPALSAYKEALCRYVLTVTARPWEGMWEMEALGTRVGLTDLRESPLPWQEAETLCRRLIRGSMSPVVRLKTTQRLEELLWTHMEELTAAQRNRGARVSWDLYHATGQYRYYERSEWFVAGYPQTHPRPGMPEPQPDKHATLEELTVNYEKQRAGEYSYMIGGGKGLVGANLLGDDRELRQLDVVLGPSANTQEETSFVFTDRVYALPELVSAIHAGAFHGAEALQVLKVPHSVKHLDEGAFEGCTGLQKLYLPQAFSDRTPRSLGLADTVCLIYT